MTERRTRFYLDKQNAKWSGVCAGIADYTGINVMWVRIGAIAATISFAFPLGFLAYWIAAKTAATKPGELYHRDPEEQKFWQGVRRSPKRSVRDVKSRLRHIDRKLADMEMYYTSNNQALSNEIEELR